jgi:hypothetical protein
MEDDLVQLLTQACLDLLQGQGPRGKADGIEETAERILRVMDARE